MSYATLSDLYGRFGESEIIQLTDADNTGTPDETTVDQAFADAAAEINAALVGRYRLPMSPVPELLTRIACDLARESFYTDVMPDIVKNRAATARRLLASIASGTLRFEDAEPAAKGAVTSDARITKRRRRMRWPADGGGGLC